jgi:TonB family protein
MSLDTSTVIDVFSVREIARAAGVSTQEVRGLVASGRIEALEGGFVRQTDAVRAVHLLWGAVPDNRSRELFRPPAAPRRSPGGALAASGALHAALVGAIVFISSLGLATAPTEARLDAMRLIFRPIPGPGGGGGGGGLRQPTPPARAELKGSEPVRSPVPPPKPVTTRPPEPKAKPTPPPPPAPTPRPVDPPPPPKPEVTPQVVAPVVTAPADAQNRAGVVTESAPVADSHGPGSGGGAGTGQGTGLGEGDGTGLGPGSGGGTGGGPYRPGSGITPPTVLREVKPDYTEEARRRGIAGDVVLEIVVRRDGTVGSIRLLQGLGSGLDQRAIDAVRAWRFNPALRFGTPVDVMVEVAVEFKLR